jgi:ribosome biogenesis GTPase
LGTSLNENFNLRRLERYLTLARESGAQPVVLLTKADLCEDAVPLVEEVRGIAADAPIHAISVVTGQGMDAVRGYLKAGATGVILGSSGIGKSTLVNYLADADIQDMMEAREFDDKGRHCTTFRHLVKTTAGGLIIDTPGLRGLSLGEANDALMSTFADVETLAAGCKFTNCEHETEPGCAIKSALEAGTLDAGRLESYLKLRREVVSMAARENRIADRKQKKLEKRAATGAEKKEKRAWDFKNRRRR